MKEEVNAAVESFGALGAPVVPKGVDMDGWLTSENVGADEAGAEANRLGAAVAADAAEESPNRNVAPDCAGAVVEVPKPNPDDCNVPSIPNAGDEAGVDAGVLNGLAVPAAGVANREAPDEAEVANSDAPDEVAFANSDAPDEAGFANSDAPDAAGVANGDAPDEAGVPKSEGWEDDVDGKRFTLEVTGVAKEDDDVPKTLVDPNGIELLRADEAPKSDPVEADGAVLPKREG